MGFGGFMQGAADAANRPPLVAAVGCGHWGKNIARNLARLGALHSICDPNHSAASKVSADHGAPIRTLNEVLLDPRCVGIALASPASLHGEQVRHALNAGKHVFVEKPLALNVTEGYELAHLARQQARILMVGHLLQYHPHILKLIDLVRDGHLGQVRRIYANRLSPGKLRAEEDVIWSFAPHDLSVILALMGKMPRRVWAEGDAVLNGRSVDVATIFMEFSAGVAARVYVSWMSPHKEQKLTVVGTKGTAVFDDRARWEDKLLMYSHQVTHRDGRPSSFKAEPTQFEIEVREPLREECSHFLQAISDGTVPRTDSAEALRVMSVLDAASKALRLGRPVSLGPPQFRIGVRNPQVVRRELGVGAVVLNS